MSQPGSLGPGDVIGDRFRLTGEIGEGGMGRVFEAQDLRHDRPAAVKLISRRLARDAEFRARFVREAEAAEHANHPHVLPVWDHGADLGYLYLATPLCDTDLASLIDQYGLLDIDVALGIVGQIAWALDWAHARGVLHRDVKPENILLVSGPQGPHAYLGDFGMARVASSSTLTQVGQLAGLSPMYAAPEQWSGEGAVAASDQYALAATLYCCLTGQPPYARFRSASELREAHMNEPVPALESAVDPRLAELSEPLMRGMAKDPQDRYESCEDLVAAVREAATGVARPVDVRVQTDPEHPWAGVGGRGRGDVRAGSESPPPPVGATAEEPTSVDQEALTAAEATRAAEPGGAPPHGPPPAEPPSSMTTGSPSADPPPAGRDGRTGRHKGAVAAVLAGAGAAAVAAVVLLSGGSGKVAQQAAPSPPAGQRIAGGLGPIPTNKVTGKGDAVVRLNRNQASVSVTYSGLLDNAPHAIHIHAGAKGQCPPASAAKIHNGHPAIATLDGGPFYGHPVTALTERGDTSPKSILAFPRFPSAGGFHYTRSMTVSPVVASYLREDNAVIIVHGIDYNRNTIYDGTLDRSDLNRRLPGEATAPALCGPLAAQAKAKKASAEARPGTTVYTASLVASGAAAPALLCTPGRAAEAGGEPAA